MKAKATAFSSTDAKNALKFTEDIIKQTGPRLTGDPSNALGVNLIKDKFDPICDEVQKESFSVHPKAFLGYIRLIVSLYVVSTVFIWVNLPLLAGILITVGLSALVFEFFLYYEYVDAFWVKKTGTNVVGIIEPEKEVKQQILISGHHDSAFVFNFLIHQPKLYSFRLFGGIGSAALLWIFSWIWSIFQAITNRNPNWAIVFKIFTLVSLLIVLQMWFFRGNEGTPGAGDNLISVGIAHEIGKKIAKMKKEGKGLDHTRIMICSWDAEEAGLRGARAYAKKHKEELTQIPTYNFNIDCPYTLADLFFLTSDINGSVKLSTKMAKECEEIAHSMNYPATHKPIAFLLGGTDAAELAKIGVEATTLMAMPWGNSERAAEYHTPDDTVDAIEPEVVEAALNIVWGYIEKKEAEIKSNE
ncbi:MAG: M28 family metallopeptidase [Promethearchaeota archaeon]